MQLLSLSHCVNVIQFLRNIYIYIYIYINPERKGTAPSGPMFSQGMPRVGVKQGYGDHVRKGEMDWSAKAPGLKETSPMNHGNISNLGPLKSSPLPSEPVGVDMGQRLRSDPGPSAQSHKRTPSSVKGKNKPLPGAFVLSQT